MLQAISILTLLIPIPVWLLMIFAPRHDMTHKLTHDYLAFIPLGILFVFLVVGLLSMGGSLNDQVSAALSAISADPKAAAADQVKTLANALTLVQNTLPTMLLVVVALSSVMDLAGGHIIYAETQRMGTRPVTAGVLLVLTYLTGSLGMLIFALWLYLIRLRETTPTASAVAEHAAS